MTFLQYLAEHHGVGLPDSATMLAKLGISPDVPHEIDILRMTKQMKLAAAQAPMKTAVGVASTGRRRGRPR